MYLITTPDVEAKMRPDVALKKKSRDGSWMADDAAEAYRSNQGRRDLVCNIEVGRNAIIDDLQHRTHQDLSHSRLLSTLRPPPI